MAELQPYWPYIVMALNGLLAGTLASLILGGGGLIRNLVIGIIGAFLGGYLVNAGLLSLPAGVRGWATMVPYGEQILVSTIGALLVVVLARVLAR